jgi:hypothetical protein
MKSRLLCVAMLVGSLLPACGTSIPSVTQTQPGGDTNITAEWQGITLVFPSIIGNDWLGKTIAADPANADAPQNWLIAAHEELTFPSYPVKNLYQPARIMVFAVSDWQNYNPEAEKRILALKQLLKAKPTTFGAQDTIPVLPVFNAVQVFRAHVNYVDFQNGSGARFITQYDQGPIPINNSELFYAFQGITTDGNYYVAAFFPLTYAALPADASNAITVIGSDFLSYLDRTVKTLGTAVEDSFSPTLGTLDKMLNSLKVK